VSIGGGSSTGSSDKAIKAEARRQALSYPGLAPVGDGPLTIRTICAGVEVPDGYVVIDKRWDPGSCNRPERVEANVLVLARTVDAQAEQLEICAGFGAVPATWVKAGERWVPGGVAGARTRSRRM
jgi:hypothetical protein